jgi:hypothetical protein
MKRIAAVLLLVALAACSNPMGPADHTTSSGSHTSSSGS